MPKLLTKTLNDAMLDIVAKFLANGGTEPIDLDELARYAISTGEWTKHGGTLLQLCKRDLSRALREQYHTDPQGRQVRTYHARKQHESGGTQRVFWADLRTAPPEHIEMAFQQRRGQVVGDCRQLKMDVDSYNENNAHGGFYQLILDFTDDIAELEQPTQYKVKPR
jgi:hypothetical protein